MKYSNTAITQLNRWYKQILIKCAIFNAAVITVGVMMAAPAMADSYTPVETRQIVKAGETRTFDNNSFTDLTNINGGALNNAGTTTITDSLFNGNSAKGNTNQYGGAIYSSGKLTISGTEFSNNSAVYGSDPTKDYTMLGGAIYSTGTTVIDESTFTGNSVNSGKPRGAAVYNNGGNMTITNSTFQKNEVINSKGVSDGMGSAVYNTTGRMILENNLFGNGENETDKGNIFTYAFVSNSGTVFMKDNTFRGNKDGGVDIQGAVNAYISGDQEYSGVNNTDAEKLKTAFSVNSYDNPNVTFGMSYDENYSPVEASGTNLFTDNNAYDGAGMRISRHPSFPTDEAIVAFAANTNNTFSENTSLNNGGAIHNNATLNFDAGSNTILTNNKAGKNGGAVYNDVKGTMNLNGAATFTGNTDENGANDIYNIGTVNFGNGADEDITLEGGIDGDSENKGIINKTGAGSVLVSNTLKNQTVTASAGELVLDNVNLTGSTVAMQSGSILNTLDDVINAYSSVALQTGSMFKADFIGTQSDTYSAVSGASVKLSGFNYSGDLTAGQSQDYVVADGAYIGTEGKLSQYSGGYKFTAAGNSEGSGKVTITNAGQSFINDAVEDTEEGTKTTINYDMSTSEEYYSASGDDAKIQDSNFTIEGGTDESGNPITLTAASGATGIEIENSNVTINNLTFKNFDTDYALKNNAGSTLTIKDSHFDSSNAVAIENAGTLYSDPTIYEAKVINSGSATFEDDSFKNIATTALTNSGTVNLVATSEDIEFVDNGLDVAQTNGTLNLYADNGNTITFNNGITGTGTSSINLMNGETIFNADVTGNAINLNNDSALYLGDNVSIDGSAVSNDANGGLIDLRNNRIDTLGDVTLGSDMTVLIDANLNTHEADSVGSNTISGTGNMVVDAIELLALSGNATETVNLATASNAGKVTVTDDAKSTLKTYYQSVVYDNTTGVLTMSTPQDYAKLELVGSWGTGNYIKAYSAADAANTSVGANLGYLDTQVKVNETVLGSAQTTAATTGLLSGVTIGTDADVVTALDTVAQTAAGTALDNTFTGKNTFDGATTMNDKLTITSGGADITGNTTTTGSLYAAQKDGVYQFRVGSTGNMLVGNGNFTVTALDGSMSAAAGKFTVDKDGVVTAQGLKLDGATITGITTSTEMAALLADPTTASDSNLVTEKALVGGINAIVAQKEQWAQGLLGVDTTQGTNNQLQNALNKLGTTNNISATTIAGALHELDVEKSGLDQDNVFTGANTFANANGITIANGTDPSAADYAKTNLKATADGLAIDTGLSVDGALTTTGAATIGNKLTVKAGGADITGNTTTTGSLYAAQKDGVYQFRVGSTGNVIVGNGNFTVTALDGSMSAAAGKFTVDKNGAALAKSLAFESTGSTVLVNAIDQGAAAIVDGDATTTARKETMATNATVAKTVGNLAALENKHGVTSVADIASAIDSLATNIEKATGGTFANAVWTGTVTGTKSVNYAQGVKYNDLLSSIDQISSNIGAAPKAVNGNIASANTVNANLDSLDAAIGDRSFATTTYVAPNDDLSTAVTKLDKELHSVNHEVRELRHDMNRGLASVAALSALVPNARGTGNTSLSVGTGHYHGQTAMAFGGAHWFTDNLMVNIGVASTIGHTRDATYRAGISYSF